MGSFLRQFNSSLPPDSDKSAGPSGDQPAFDPEVFYTKTLADLGYEAGTDPCCDKCTDAFNRCLASGTGPALCLAQLNTCMQNCARNKPGPPLGPTGTAYVRVHGGTSPEPSPQLGVDYDLCVNVFNNATAASGPFKVIFNLEGKKYQQFPVDHPGLAAGTPGLVVYHLGKFPDAREYELEACVYTSSGPSGQVKCTATIKFVVQ
jgi:hypothetical protein